MKEIKHVCEFRTFTIDECYIHLLISHRLQVRTQENGQASFKDIKYKITNIFFSLRMQYLKSDPGKI